MPIAYCLTNPSRHSTSAINWRVLALTQTLSRQKGLSVIAVLHDINMAAQFCDEIVALHSGRLIARGTPAEIMRPAELDKIYNVRMDVMQQRSGRLVAVAQ